MRAVVIGAGINGLCAAWAMRRQGADITVLDAGSIPNPLGASHDHHRLIRRHYPGRPDLSRAITDAFGAWDRLWTDLGEVHYVETGVFAASVGEGDWADRAQRSFADARTAYEPFEADEAERRLRFLVPDSVRHVVYTRDGGALLADRILDGLASRLREEGAELRPDCSALSVDPERGAVCLASGETLRADAIICCANYGNSALGVPALPSVPMRSLTVYVEPPDDAASLYRDMPCWLDLGGTDDAWGIAPVAGLPMKLGLGALTRPWRPDADRTMSAGEIETILAYYGRRFRGLDRARVVRAVANLYGMAPDEEHRIARHGRAIVVDACSGHGFKFGALTGERAAAMALAH